MHCLEYSEVSLIFLLFKKKQVFPYLKAQEIFLVLEIQYNLSFLLKKKKSLLILTFPGICRVFLFSDFFFLMKTSFYHEFKYFFLLHLREVLQEC